MPALDVRAGRPLASAARRGPRAASLLREAEFQAETSGAKSLRLGAVEDGLPKKLPQHVADRASHEELEVGSCQVLVELIETLVEVALGTSRFGACALAWCSLHQVASPATGAVTAESIPGSAITGGRKDESGRRF